MHYRLVVKHEDGAKAKAHGRQLNSVEEPALGRFIRGSALSEFDRALMNRLLRILEELEIWVEQVDDDGLNPALLTLVNREGRYHFRCFARELVFRLGERAVGIDEIQC